MKYVSIDLETTGLDPNTCQILEFGAVIDDTEKPEVSVENLPTMGAIMAWKYIKGEPYALNLNKIIVQEILTDAIVSSKDGHSKFCTPSYLGQVFRNFCVKNGLLGEWGNGSSKIIAAGKNFASFDLPFLKAHPNFTESAPPFHHRSLDPGMFFLRADDKVPPDMKVCKERAGIAGEVAHTAIEDAIDVIKLIRKGLSK